MGSQQREGQEAFFVSPDAPLEGSRCRGCSRTNASVTRIEGWWRLSKELQRLRSLRIESISTNVIRLSLPPTVQWGRSAPLPQFTDEESKVRGNLITCSVD